MPHLATFGYGRGRGREVRKTLISICWEKWQDLYRMSQKVSDQG